MVVEALRFRRKLTSVATVSWTQMSLAEYSLELRHLVLREDSVGVRLIAFYRSNANEKKQIINELDIAVR